MKIEWGYMSFMMVTARYTFVLFLFPGMVCKLINVVMYLITL